MPFKILQIQKYIEYKDTHSQKVPINKSQVGIIMDNWVVGTLNELFLRGFHIKIKKKISKK